MTYLTPETLFKATQDSKEMCSRTPKSPSAISTSTTNFVDFEEEGSFIEEMEEDLKSINIMRKNQM